MDRGRQRKVLAILLSTTVALAALVISATSVLWETEERITRYSGWDILPYITQLSNGSVWVFWQCKRPGNFDIYYSSYNWAYGNFSREKTVFSDPDPSHDISPSFLELQNGTMLVFWSSVRTGYYDVYCASSNDDGTTWSQAMNITSNIYDDTDPIPIQASDGTIWLVWLRDLPTENKVLCRTYSGASWSTETVLSIGDYPINDNLPFICQMRDGRIWVVWGTLIGGNFEIVYRIHDGTSWSELFQLTYSSDDDTDPCVVQTRDGTIWVIWASGSLPNREDDIYYQTSTDNGQTWSDTSEVTTSTNQNPEAWPSAAQISDKKLWVVYVSSRNDNYDLYYTKTEITVHDVAVTNVEPSKTEANRGETVLISVTAENQGDYNETFTVNCYADSTLIGSQTIYLTLSNATTVLIFPWDTLSFTPGDYVLKANATTVLGENPINTDDNSLTDGTVNIVSPDIAVLSVSTSKTAVFQGLPVQIYVTVENQGTITTSFTVSALRNSTLISTKEITDLAAGATKTVTITWDTSTTSPSKAKYLISGSAEPLPGEIDTADNTKDDGMVQVKIPGDVDGDGDVDIADLFAIARALNTNPTWPHGTGWNQWNPECDINDDDKVNVFDLWAGGKNYGMEAP